MRKLCSKRLILAALVSTTSQYLQTRLRSSRTNPVGIREVLKLDLNPRIAIFKESTLSFFLF